MGGRGASSLGTNSRLARRRRATRTRHRSGRSGPVGSRRSGLDLQCDRAGLNAVRGFQSRHYLVDHERPNQSGYDHCACPFVGRLAVLPDDGLEPRGWAQRIDVGRDERSRQCRGHHHPQCLCHVGERVRGGRWRVRRPQLGLLQHDHHDDDAADDNHDHVASDDRSAHDDL